MLWLSILLSIIPYAQSVCEGNSCVCDSVQQAAIDAFSASTCLEITDLDALSLKRTNRIKRVGERGTAEVILNLELQESDPSGSMLTLVSAILARDVMGYILNFVCSTIPEEAPERIAEGRVNALVSYPVEAFGEKIQPFISDGSVTLAGFIGASHNNPQGQSFGFYSSGGRDVMSNDILNPFHDFGLYLRKLSISQEQYTDLGSLNVRGNEYENACMWIKGENATWNTWLSQSFITPKELTWELSESSVILMSGFTAVGLFIGAVAFGFVFLYREHKAIKGISADISLAIIALLMIFEGSSLLWLEDEPDEITCALRLYLPTMSITAALALLGAKTYRISKIFNSMVTDYEFISTGYLIKWIVFPTIFTMLVLLSIIYGVRAPEPETESTSSSGNDVTLYTNCDFSIITFAVIMAYLTIGTLTLTYFAFKIRNSPIEFNEAGNIARALYCALFAAIIGSLGVGVANWQQQYEFIHVFISVMFVFTAVSIILSLFTERIIWAMRGEDLKSDRTRTFFGGPTASTRDLNVSKANLDDYKLTRADTRVAESKEKDLQNAKILKKCKDLNLELQRTKEMLVLQKIENCKLEETIVKLMEKKVEEKAVERFGQGTRDAA
mmetsp:Transcript_4139/g.6097  ORF Transcript_4139/g.6097 Transcript_4139/m.6097 type:complete len:615 (+) Transcript_4139:84-1928(+)